MLNEDIAVLNAIVDRTGIDPAAIDEYLTYQYVPHLNCIFRGYQKLPPGHLAVYENDKLQVRPYWRPDFSVSMNTTKN